MISPLALWDTERGDIQVIPAYRGNHNDFIFTYLGSSI